MKTKLMLLCFLPLIWQGCQSTQKQKEYMSSREADSLGFFYLKLKADSTYALQLTEEEAERIGISPSDFQRMHRDVQSANAMVKELSVGDRIDPKAELEKKGLKSRVP